MDSTTNKRSAQRRGVNATGRSERKELFFMLTFSMARATAWRSLSGAALKVFIELRCTYDGSNNGKLFISYQDAAKKLHLSKSTVHRAFEELAEKGFIRKRRDGLWLSGMAAEWFVTDVPAREGQEATRDWRHWHPTQKQKMGTQVGRSKPKRPTTVPIEAKRPATVPIDEPESPPKASRYSTACTLYHGG